MIRILFLATLLGYGVAAGAAGGRRHLVFVRSEPGDKAVLRTAPGEIRLYFNEKPLIEKTKIQLSDSLGHDVTLAKAALATGGSTPAVAKISGAMARGSYRVTWESAAQDGHTAKGSFRFRLQ